VIASVNDAGLNLQIFADEVCGVSVVGEDSANLGRSKKDELRLFAPEELEDRRAVGQVEFRVGAKEKTRKPLPHQFPADR
jgi:hypothetical protein